MTPSQSLRAVLTCFALAGVCALLLWSCCGCASHVAYTAADWAALTCAVVGSAADVYTTERCLDQNNGGRELNPVYGSDPSDGKLIAGKLVALAVCAAVGEWQPGWRVWMYGLLGGTGAMAAAWNWREN